mmetsp:Transcript_17328/g.39241  ORF Transcript_17328/g.39241 Transcript_17328/m.39241 type:complete len:233 (+) Transcript_17328:88-786(+)
MAPEDQAEAEQKQQERWDAKTAEAYFHHSLTDSKLVWDAIAADLLPFSKGRAIADLGCADGCFGHRLEAASLANVDPFPPADAPHPIIAMDGVAYLETCDAKSLDLIFATFAVHLMDRQRLNAEMERVLGPGGRAIFFSVSKNCTFFGSPEYNELFFSMGFEKSGSKDGEKPARTLTIKIPQTHEQLHAFVTNRTWSNLKVMPEETIEKLASLVPKDLQSVDVSIDVFEFVH